MTIPNPASGNWRLEFSLPVGSTAEIPVAITTIMNSPTQVGLLASPADVVLEKPVNLTLAGFSSGTPLTGAQVQVQIVSPTGAVTNLALLDNGVAPDTAVNDGLYGAVFVPLEVGTFDALATVTATAGGTSVVRQAAAGFTVVAPTLALLGTVASHTEDANFNGLIDALVLEVSANVLQAGEFLVRAVLTSTTGDHVERTGRAVLTTGNGTIPIVFSADDIRALGANGPYRIGPVEAVLIGPLGAQPADRLEDAGQTIAVLLDQLEQPAIRFAGTFRDAGVDLDADNLFDRLNVDLDMVFKTPASYSWSAILFDSNGKQIGFSASSGFISTSLASIRLVFDGRLIGANGVDGPYRIGNLLVTGPGVSLVLLSVTPTSPFLARQFEGFVSSVPPVAEAGPDRRVRIGSPVVLDGSASADPDSAPAPLTFSWAQTGGPSTALTGATTATPGFTPTVAGTYAFTLTVSDGGASDDDGVSIAVPILGDVDGDGDVDNADLSAVVAARNTPASNVNDVRDLNADGRIDVVDARLLTTLCTRARCAVQ